MATSSKTAFQTTGNHENPLNDHRALVAQMTGGMVQPVKAFSGSFRLRDDGRPLTDFRQELRVIGNVRNALAVLWLLMLPFIITVGVVLALDAVNTTASNSGWASAPLLSGAATVAIIAVAVVVMGGVHLRMFVLHHEAAHRLLFSRRRANDLIGINILGWFAFGTGAHAYRRVHTRHHRDEFGPDEPDFLLYSFYPIESGSMYRKLLRDAVGISAWRITRSLITGIVRRRRWLTSLRFYLGQVIVFALFVLAGHPWLYLLLWVLPYATVYQVINRLRAIAEHGGMTRSDDRRITTHHVQQSWFTQRWLTPYQVGHHLAHHVDSGVPFRNLPKLTQALAQDGYITNSITWSGYRSLWRAMVRHADEPA